MWIKNLRQRKLQTVMIFLIIMLCSMLLTGAMSILTSLEKPYKDFSKETKAASAKVYTYTASDEKAILMGEQFAKLDIVKSVDYLRQHSLDEDFMFKGKKIESFTNLTEYNENIVNAARYLEGNKNSASTLSDNECLLPACISTEYNIHVGDKVTIKFAEKDITYTVKAVYSNPYQTSSTWDPDMMVKNIPEFAANKLNILLYGKNGVTGSQIEEAYREKYDGQLNGLLYSLEQMIDNSLIVGHILGAIFLAIGVIMLLVSGLMIHYMVKNAMITDAKSIAVYKTIGYTSNDILFMYLKLYFAVVSLASIVGIVCSVFVSNAVLTSIFENMGQLAANSPLIPGALCYLFTVSFVISIITFIISKTKNVKPVIALNGQDHGGIKKKKNYKGNSKLQFSPLGIAYRTFARDKKNAIGIIVTCVVTIFAVNFAVISLDIANTMKENNDFWLGVDKSDVMISVPNNANYDFVKKAVEEDDRIDYYLQNAFLDRVTLKWKKGMTVTRMNAFTYDDFEKAELPVVEGRNPKNANEIAIGTTMADELNKNIGDYIEVYLDGEQKENMLITGFFQTYMQMGDMCRLTTSAYTENNYKHSYNNISIYLKNSKDMKDFIKDIKDKIGGSGTVIERTEQYSTIMKMIATPQQKAIPPVAALVLLVAGINIFSIVMLKNIKAHKTNGIYKCIGYTTGHLILSNLYYVGAIALTSVVIALPISVATYPTIMKVSLSMFSFVQYPVQYNFLHLAIANFAMIIIFIVSALVSSKALFKVNARDLVQE